MKSSKPTPTYRKKIGYAIRARREALGVSQEQLAELTDFHRNYIGLVERAEQNLTLDSLVRIAEALNCKASDLLLEAEI